MSSWRRFLIAGEREPDSENARRTPVTAQDKIKPVLSTTQVVTPAPVKAKVVAKAKGR